MFIRHRTADEISEAENTKWQTLRDPQPDSDRVKKPEWLIMLGKSPTIETSKDRLVGHCMALLTLVPR